MFYVLSGLLLKSPAVWRVLFLLRWMVTIPGRVGFRSLTPGEPMVRIGHRTPHVAQPEDTAPEGREGSSSRPDGITLMNRSCWVTRMKV
jgi:hypothetical protein